MKQKRVAKIERKTKETAIKLELNLDGSGKTNIKSGIGFLDHMLDLLAFHGMFDLKLKCDGDLEIDTHHTTEDIALALSCALAEAVGEKKGIFRCETGSTLNSFCHFFSEPHAYQSRRQCRRDLKDRR